MTPSAAMPSERGCRYSTAGATSAGELPSASKIAGSVIGVA